MCSTAAPWDRSRACPHPTPAMAWSSQAAVEHWTSRGAASQARRRARRAAERSTAESDPEAWGPWLPEPDPRPAPFQVPAPRTPTRAPVGLGPRPPLFPPHFPPQPWSSRGFPLDYMHLLPELAEHWDMLRQRELQEQREPSSKNQGTNTKNRGPRNNPRTCFRCWHLWGLFGNVSRMFDISRHP